MAAHLQPKLFQCVECNEIVETSKLYLKYLESHDLDIDKSHLNTHPFFGNVLLHTGAGHMEMNMLKSLFKFGWEIIFRLVATLHGYRSTAAHKYALKCGDHHKSWQLFTITFDACMSELLLPDVLDCNKKQNCILTAQFK